MPDPCTAIQNRLNQLFSDLKAPAADADRARADISNLERQVTADDAEIAAQTQAVDFYRQQQAALDAQTLTLQHQGQQLAAQIAQWAQERDLVAAELDKPEIRDNPKQYDLLLDRYHRIQAVINELEQTLADTQRQMDAAATADIQASQNLQTAQAELQTARTRRDNDNRLLSVAKGDRDSAELARAQIGADIDRVNDELVQCQQDNQGITDDGDGGETGGGQSSGGESGTGESGGGVEGGGEGDTGEDGEGEENGNDEPVLEEPRLQAQEQAKVNEAQVILLFLRTARERQARAIQTLQLLNERLRVERQQHERLTRQHEQAGTFADEFRKRAPSNLARLSEIALYERSLTALTRYAAALAAQRALTAAEFTSNQLEGRIADLNQTVVGHENQRAVAQEVRVHNQHQIVLATKRLTHLVKTLSQ